MVASVLGMINLYAIANQPPTPPPAPTALVAAALGTITMHFEMGQPQL